MTSVTDSVVSNPNITADANATTSAAGATDDAAGPQPIVVLDSTALYAIIAVGSCICLMLLLILIVLLLRRRHKADAVVAQTQASELETMDSAASTRSGYSTPLSSVASRKEYASAAAVTAAAAGGQTVNYGSFDADYASDNQITYQNVNGAIGGGNVVYDVGLSPTNTGSVIYDVGMPASHVTYGDMQSIAPRSNYVDVN